MFVKIINFLAVCSSVERVIPYFIFLQIHSGTLGGDVHPVSSAFVCPERPKKKLRPCKQKWWLPDRPCGSEDRRTQSSLYFLYCNIIKPDRGVGGEAQLGIKNATRRRK